MKPDRETLKRRIARTKEVTGADLVLDITPEDVDWLHAGRTPAPAPTPEKKVTVLDDSEVTPEGIAAMYRKPRP